MKYQRLESSSSSHGDSELSTEVVSISNPIQLAEQQCHKSLFIKVLLRETIYEVRECHVDSSVADLKTCLASKSLIPEIRQRLIYNGFSLFFSLPFSPYIYIYIYIHTHIHAHKRKHHLSQSIFLLHPPSLSRYLYRYIFLFNLFFFNSLMYFYCFCLSLCNLEKGKSLLPNDKTIGSFGVGDNCCIHLFPIPEARTVVEPSSSTFSSDRSSIQSTPTSENSSNISFMDSFNTFQPVICPLL